MKNLEIGERVYLNNEDGTENLYEVLGVTGGPGGGGDVGIYDLRPLDGGKIDRIQFHEFRERVLANKGRLYTQTTSKGP